MMPSNHLILFLPLLLLPSIFPGIRVSSNELALHIRRPKDWSFSFSISLSNEYSGLISFRIDWFELLDVQGTLKNILQPPVRGELWCWRGLLRVPWTAKRSNQSILKDFNPEYSLERLMLKLKLQPPVAKSCLIRKDPDTEKH